MAKATKLTVPTPPPPVVMLELTDKEAQALANITQGIGGDPSGSRGLMDGIAQALSFVGYMDQEGTTTGSIYFKETQ